MASLSFDFGGVWLDWGQQSELLFIVSKLNVSVSLDQNATGL